MKRLCRESNQVKNNPEEKKLVVLLADFQVILEAAEGRALIEIKAGFAILGALFLVRRGTR